MKFKKGQKVWSEIQKRYMYVSQVEENGCFLADDESLLKNYWHTFDEIQLLKGVDEK